MALAHMTFEKLRKNSFALIHRFHIWKISSSLIEGEDGQFLLETVSGVKIATRKLLFAIGMKDRDLGIPGLAEVIKSAFVCPYCDGWELRDQQLVVINRGATLMHFVPLLSGWSKQLVVCTNGPDELSEAETVKNCAHIISRVFNAPIHSI